MGLNCSIEWTDHSANLWWGCTHHGPGCLNCYAELLAKRVGGQRWGSLWGPDRPRRYIAGWRSTLNGAVRIAREKRRRQMVFINDMSDLFEDPDKHTGPMINDHGETLNIHNRQIATTTGWDPLRISHLVDMFFESLNDYPSLIFQLLTKRPNRTLEVLKSQATRLGVVSFPNVWLGTSINELNDKAKADILSLTQSRAFVDKLFVSYEPATGPCDLRGLPDLTLSSLDWIITGGESGHDARLFDLDWMHQTQTQASAANIAVFNKQLGSNPLQRDEITFVNGTKHADISGWPPILRVRDFPISNEEFTFVS